MTSSTRSWISLLQSQPLAFFGRTLACALPLGLLAACATAPNPSGALNSYDGLRKSKAIRTQASVRVEASVLEARSLRLEPVRFAAEASANATPAQVILISNAMGRVLCKQLSARFDLVGPSVPADITMKVVVTRLRPTDAGMAGVSVVLSSLAPAPFIRRIPVGLGGFTSEAEATDASGHQVAAMTWSRDADILSSGRASTVGDAYDFSVTFAKDLAALLVTGKDPVRNLSLPKFPRRGRPASAACATYGKGPGFAGRVGANFGAPPEWTDRQGSTKESDRPGR